PLIGGTKSSSSSLESSNRDPTTPCAFAFPFAPRGEPHRPKMELGLVSSGESSEDRRRRGGSLRRVVRIFDSFRGIHAWTCALVCVLWGRRWEIGQGSSGRKGRSGPVGRKMFVEKSSCRC